MAETPDHYGTSEPEPHVESHGDAVTPERTRPRTGPIVWGALFLAFCAWITQRAFFPEAIAPELWLTAIAIGLGVLLLGVGIAVGVRDRRGREPHPLD